ncbi:MAG: hypothetical protein JWM38_2718 [Sphingomonas bacterium]|jgi:hypothetical protein|nr:hypothetical protein [Sphingomonas bacterium]
MAVHDTLYALRIGRIGQMPIDQAAQLRFLLAGACTTDPSGTRA